jgi:hypothetical protein
VTPPGPSPTASAGTWQRAWLSTPEGFHPTVLTYWRTRLRASDRPERVFDAVRQVVEATGVLKGKTRRALDSSLLDDAVATQDIVTRSSRPSAG